MQKSGKSPAHRTESALAPWQTWGTTLRYLVICLVLAVLAVLLTWLASGHF